MKRCFILGLSVLLVVLTACGRPSPPSTDTPAPSIAPPSEAASQDSIEVETTNPLLLADFASRSIYSGSGKRIGRYGYIVVEKSTLPNLQMQEYAILVTIGSVSNLMMGQVSVLRVQTP